MLTPRVQRHRRMLFAVATLLVTSQQVVRAGGPGPSERLFQFGRCNGDTPCAWDCNEADNPRCTVANTECLPPAPLFAARIRLSINDQVCPGNGGGRLTIAVAGQRSDGVQFTIPDTTIDFCGIALDQFECGGSLNLCPGVNQPRETMFLCSTNVPNDRLDESSVPDVFWLQYTNFLPSMAQALTTKFPGVPGEPIILTTRELSYDDQLDSPAPSVRDVCVTGTFGTLSAATPFPAPVGLLPTTTSTATLDLGACPTLPIVTTTTTSTTLPPRPCDGLAADSTVGCLVDQGASSCPDAIPPGNVGRLRDRAVTQVNKALAAAKLRRRTARLVAAEQSLRTARHSVSKRPRLDQTCREAMRGAIEAAIAFVHGL